MLRIDRLDHLVATVADINAVGAFYSRVLGITRSERRHALRFESAKIDLHEDGCEFELKATSGPLEQDGPL